MKLLLVSDFFHPFIGGTERQTQLLAQNLVKHGHDVHVATIWHHGLKELEENNGITIHRIKGLSTRIPWFSSNPTRRYHPPFPDPSVVIELRKIIKNFEPEIINSSGWITYSCAVASLGFNTKFILSARDYSHFCAIHTLIYNQTLCTGPKLCKCMKCATGKYGRLKGFASSLGVFFGRYLLNHTINGVHSISNFVHDQIDSHLLTKRRAEVEHQVIASFLDDDDPNIFGEHDDFTGEFASNLPEEKFILFVGSLQAHKGFNLLLEAYTQIANPPPLVLIGTTWSDTPTTFPKGVLVFSNIPHSQVMVAWRRCLFGIAPGLWPEPLGNVVMEGMSQAKPMIGTKPGGHTDLIIQNETGFLIKSGDVEDLVHAMEQLINKPDLGVRQGQSAQDRIKRYFTSSSTIPEFEHFFTTISERK